MEKRNYGSSKAAKSYSSKKKDSRKYESKDLRKDGDTETRKFEGELKPLMTEDEKKDAQVLELSYDFSCRIIRLYKYLNEGKLSRRIGILLMRWEGNW